MVTAFRPKNRLATSRMLKIKDYKGLRTMAKHKKNGSSLFSNPPL